MEGILEWLEAKGVKFEIPINMPPSHSIHFFTGKIGSDRIGATIAKTMVHNIENQGSRILYQSRAKQLITNRKGEVVGVLAEKDGKPINISGKSVIIATGGFAGNKKLLKKYMPPFNTGDDLYIGGLFHKGDGLRMAMAVGAATEFSAAGEISVNRVPWSATLFLIVKHPKTLWVNKNGERFVNESVHEPHNAQYRQPGKIAYTLIDEGTKQSIYGDELAAIDKFILASDMTLDVIDEKIQNTLRKERLFAANKPWPQVADKELRWLEKRGEVRIADSWDKIAEWMGADPDILKATIDEYNAACDKGHDDIFAKDKKYLLPLRTPPYYAIKCHLILQVTHGGIKVNENMEVLDRDGKPIPGLFAAGVEAATMDTDTYGPIGGHGLGFAINSGRIAGENAARSVSGGK